MKKCAPFVAALLLFIAPNSSALEISVNGVSRRSISSVRLQEIARLRPVSGEVRQSVVLEELLPPFAELQCLVIRGDGEFSLQSGTSGEDSVMPLYRSYLLPEDDGSLTFHTEAADASVRPATIVNVRSIEVEGESVTPGELEIWIAWEGVSELKEEIRRWGRIHGIGITVNEVPKSDSKLLSVLRGGGQPPDVVLIQSDYLPALTAAGALQPMVRFPLEQFADKSLEAFRLDRMVWAVPFYFDAQMLFYRTDLVELPFDDPGGSGTEDGWDLPAFERTARELRDRGISPSSWNAYSAYWLVPFQIGFGKGQLLEADGTVRVDDQATYKAVCYLKGLADEGILDLRERDSMFSRFISGEVAMMLSASFSIPELQRLEVPFGTAPFPAGPAAPLAPLLDFKGFAVTRKTKHPVLARRFLLSMSDPGVQHSFTSAVFKLPVAEDAWLMAERTNPYYQSLRTAYATGVPVPSTRGYTVYKNTMWKMLRFLLTGQMPVRPGLEQAQSLIDAQMSR